MKTMTNENTWLYQFLISPSYRWLRHLTLIIMVALIAFNQLHYIFDIRDEEYKYVAYLPVTITFFLYLAGGYLNIYYLIPTYFLTRRFGKYILWFGCIVLIISWTLVCEEYLILQIPGIESKPGSYFYEHEHLILTLLSDIIVLSISLFGCSITVILKSWMFENKELNQLENKKMQMDVEQVKEKVSPAFLFSILHTMGELAETESAQASAMLLRLSRLLRYQLYEGNQEKVLLTSEIQFLTNYLLLEQYHTPGFEFSVETDGELHRLFISPLLLLPFVQHAVNEWKSSTTKNTLEFFFTGKEEMLYFGYSYPEIIPATKQIPLLLFKRLDLLYKERYSIQEESNKFNLMIQI